MSNSNLPIQVLTVSSVSLLNFHSTFRGYPLAPHSKVKSSPNFFATVFPSLLSNHGLTGIMIIMIIMIIKTTIMIIIMLMEMIIIMLMEMIIIMLMEMIMLLAIPIILTTATDTNDITAKYNNQG